MINIILDLDQTLISAEPIEEFDFEKNQKKMFKFNFENLDGYYLMFPRPKLDEFLDYLFANFNVSVWTAASKDYALFVIEKFILTKPNRKLDFIFFSYHCNISKKENNGLKGLNMLWDSYELQNYSKDNTLIIDDNIDVKKIQPCNCYLIPAFNFTDDNSEKDDELSVLMTKLEKFKNEFYGQKQDCLIDNL